MAWAQAVTGTSVSGYVLDPDQAAIPGATVTLTPASGAPIITTSGADGAYNFRGVPPGTYSITVTMQGFASFVRQGVRIGATPLRLNTPLVVQTQSQEINVTAQNTTSVSVDPDNNGSSVVIKDNDLEALSDDPDELSSELSALAGPSAGPNGGQIYVDGFTGGTLPPKSSIREIRVNQNPFSAQFDRQGFGRVEVFTKPGTDKYHGNLSVQGNDKFLNTSSPFLGPANVQPDYHRIFFIGSLTGPLTKTSSYSLAGSERIIQDNSIFAGQIVSSSPASSVLCAPGDSTCSLNTYPAGNRATFHPQNRYDFTPRIDLALGEKNTLTVRYQFEHNDQQNAGLGSTSLYTTAYNTNYRENQIQISDTQILSSKVINETRFSFERGTSAQTPQSTTPTFSVQGYFSGGGSNGGTQNSNNDRYEIQNYTSVALRKNFIRAGLRYRFYREGLLSTSGSNGSFTYANPAAYIANQPLQYSTVNINNPHVEGNVGDIGIYAEDDWKAKSNLTVSYGIRYEAQSDIHSNADLAPRLSVSYGVPRKTGNPLTVIRAGFGIFYDRFGLNEVINSYQQNGVNQSIIIYRAPGAGCSPSNLGPCGAGAPVSNTVYQLAPNLRSAYNMQTALGVDQQLPGRTTLSFNYINTIGVHQYFSRSIPVSGSNGQFVYQYQSGGVFRENQLLINVRSQLSNRFSIFGFYALSGADGNANGAGSFPTDSLNPRVDYGRALFVRRNAVFLFGNWQSPLGFNFSPFLNASSGNFYNITTGTDLNGDTRINDRAGFANGTSGNCKNALDFTLSVTSANRVPPGYCTGPANVSFNLRAVKVFGFGERRGNAATGGGPQGGPPGGGGPRGGGGGGRGGGGGGFGGGANSGRKYTLNVGAQIQNLFNYVPYSTPVGSLSAYNSDPSKNLFGRSTSLNSFGPGGGTSAVRTVTLLATFNF